MEPTAEPPLMRHSPEVAARRRRRGTARRYALEPTSRTPPMRHSSEMCAGADSRPAIDEASPEVAARRRRRGTARRRFDVADSRLATDEAQPGGVRWNRQQRRHRCGTAWKCALETAAEPPPTRHSPKVRAECDSKAPPTRHSPEVCTGTGSRATTDAAQPEGMRRIRQQDAADEAQPRGARWNRQQSRRRRGTAWKCALETAAEPPPTRHSPKVCAGTGSRDATDAA
jgi:hypothetical protein